MTRRARIGWFGSAGALVVAGGICALLIGGTTGDIVALTLVTLGLGEAVLLVFFEVGLSEDRDRAREEERRRRARRQPRPTGKRKPSWSYRRRP